METQTPHLGDTPDYPENGIEAFFHGLINRVDGLNEITIYDKKGISILRFNSNPHEAQQEQLDPRLNTAFIIHLKQTRRIASFGKLNYITVFTKTGFILHLNIYPLIVVFQALNTTNLGELIELLPACRMALENIRSACEMDQDMNPDR